jgi:AcrR family transcriptional regulator
MARRSDHTREELRELILKAATEIVKKSGIQKLTTRAVAKKIGYSAGTLYLIFHNVDELIFAVNARTLADLRVQMHARASQVADPVERLEVMASYYLDFGLANVDLWRLVFEHRFLGDDPFPEIITHETNAVLQAVGAALKNIVPGASNAELHGIAAGFWSGVHGVSHLAITDKLRIASEAPFHTVMKMQVDTFLRGLNKQA